MRRIDSGSPASLSAIAAAAPPRTLVPTKSERNPRLSTVTLIDCMAAMPCPAGSRARAAITNDEKAKNTPATIPHPRAAAIVRTTFKSSSIRRSFVCNASNGSECLDRPRGTGGPGRGPDAGGGRLSRVVPEVLRRSAQGALHAIAQVRVAAVHHFGEEIGQQPHEV